MIVELFTIPAVILIAGAFMLPLLPRQARGTAFILFPTIALGVLWMLPEGSLLQATLANYELHLLTVDALSRIFGTIFALITIVGGIYALHMKELGQQASALAYAGGALGVTFAGDFFTLIVYWEIMAVTSSYLIWARRTERSDKAGMRYILVHALGGGLLLSGVLLHLSEGGSLLLGPLAPEHTLSSTLMLTGVAINSAIPPLHAWLADAYPKATITGAVFMCALTTKSAVYVLIRLFPGWDILIWAGLTMAVWGTIYALLANDIREILAYSIISQIGYMVTGIGIGTEMALNGAAAHAFSHILYKSLLFMGAGAVMYATGKNKLSELGGFAKKMPLVVILYIIGGLAISGAPLFNGFISKSMIISAVGDAHMETATIILLLASIGTFLHTGLKLPYFTWFGPAKSEFTVDQVPVNMKIAMGIAAFFCVLFGVFPSLLYTYLPYPVEYHPYTAYHLVEMTQILIFGFIGFWFLKDKLNTAPNISLDLDWFYRRPARLVRTVFVRFPDRVFAAAEDIVLKAAQGISRISRNPRKYFYSGDTDASGRPVKTDDFTAPIHAAMAFILLGFILMALFVLV
ncbi:multisubunit sodium/proton antiporter, MrpD subunit [Fodinibius roseus]|uniref:Multisubunit sodium/proton antiporter, MrpD subunit n=1 Tax=Fodinibius roseus TaxID=1194090 RepID=A0A1M5BBR1_9BACT|nr:Na(+)/H(+) antiporter subunit D [Fodinibius roseus]SHF39757.1 multisubunit sodium/proton antiporter, MrpD subunit [Fodinibius roseus]